MIFWKISRKPFWCVIQAAHDNAVSVGRGPSNSADFGSLNGTTVVKEQCSIAAPDDLREQFHGSLPAYDDFSFRDVVTSGLHAQFHTVYVGIGIRDRYEDYKNEIASCGSAFHEFQFTRVREYCFEAEIDAFCEAFLARSVCKPLSFFALLVG